MAEPANTPMPPGTPVPASTPRSSSPVPPASDLTPSLQVTPNGTFTAAPSTTPQPRQSNVPAAVSAKRLTVLHIGDPIKYNHELYAALGQSYNIIRPSVAERSRAAFTAALRSGKWGAFSAILRPFWGSGGEMGRWDAELIALLPPSVRVFASAGAGFDWADTRALAGRGIVYCNSGLAAAEAVADFAVAMVISTFRHLPWCMGAATLPYLVPKDGLADDGDSSAHAAFRDCHHRATTTSHTLRGHVLGLIGLGNIGQHLAAKLGHPAFGMCIHYHDIERKSSSLETGLAATFHDDLASLLRASDCIVLCTPALPDGTALITASVLAHCKPGSRFVNVARGSLVDEEALADALESGALSAAALDVHAVEPAISPRLVSMAGLSTDATGSGRVMLTCHNAGGTVETHVGFEELSMRNVMAVLEGRNPITPVNLQWLKTAV